ncbi:LOW QUALITY PROTEIN: uncharacterized protein O3C94_017374 [Discoglossus pictus]
MASYLGDDLMTINIEAPETSGQTESHSVPALAKDDEYHVFISYSSKDSIWVGGLIHKLEQTLPCLRICYHERDFIPGKTIIDNMTESIQKSQKTLMVLSPDFVRSRWCSEANLSLVRDCMVHKAIVPIILKPCPVPVYLSHLTYLDVEDDKFFEKLVHIILNTNKQEEPDIMIHYQAAILYSGKPLMNLAAVNENDPHCKQSVFSNTSVPDSMRAVIEDPDLYMEAIEIINSTPTSIQIINSRNSKVLGLFIGLGLGGILSVIIAAFTFSFFKSNAVWCLGFPLSVIPIFIGIFRIKPTEKKETEQLMKKSTGQANLVLMETSVLAGCSSKSQLFFVYVTLHKCKQRFEVTFGRGSALAKAMWEKAVVKHSSNYACCLYRKYFPFKGEAPGHLEGGICFCQYVIHQIQDGDWP